MKDDQDLVESLLRHDADVPVPADHERRIREGLGALLGAAPIAPANAPSEAGRATQSVSDVGHRALRRWLTTGLVAAAAAGGGFAIGRSTAPRTVSAPPVVPASATAAPTVSATEMPVPSSSIVPSAPGPVTSGSATAVKAPPPPAPPSAGEGFDREQSLLERARSALVRHDADAAEKALDEHDRHFPRSHHTEERDYLRIQVLRERGDTARVRERARAFLAKYPESMLRARVEPLAE